MKKCEVAGCGMPPLEGQNACWNHSPTVAPARAAARSRGGRRARTPHLTPPPDAPPNLRGMEAIQQQLEVAYGDALQLPNGPARARVLLTALALALRVHETTEIEQRLQAIEARLSMRVA